MTGSLGYRPAQLSATTQAISDALEDALTAEELALLRMLRRSLAVRPM